LENKFLCVVFLMALANAVMVSAENGQCGPDITWELDENGLLTLTGTGDMPSYMNEDPEYKPYASSIKKIVINTGITSVGEHAFKELPVLETVEMPETVTSMGQLAFSECPSMTSVKMSTKISTIEISAFMNCKSLASISIPDKVTDIKQNAFYGCESLKSITIPNSVKTIGESAFQGCKSAKTLTLGDNIETIGESAFYMCSNLTCSITIPAKVSSIGRKAFLLYSGVFEGEVCPHLTSICYSGANDPGTYQEDDCDIFNIWDESKRDCQTAEDPVVSVVKGTYKKAKFCGVEGLKKVNTCKINPSGSGSGSNSNSDGSSVNFSVLGSQPSFWFIQAIICFVLFVVRRH